tara:strand:- start:775 stop:1068 length:294 start_codon:yes stop_codon:yes gene_type:complete
MSGEFLRLYMRRLKVIYFNSLRVTYVFFTHWSSGDERAFIAQAENMNPWSAYTTHRAGGGLLAPRQPLKIKGSGKFVGPEWSAYTIFRGAILLLTPF